MKISLDYSRMNPRVPYFFGLAFGILTGTFAAAWHDGVAWASLFFFACAGLQIHAFYIYTKADAQKCAIKGKHD